MWRLGGQNHRTVLPAELLDLGIEVWIEPVGFDGRSPEIVGHQHHGRAAEVMEGVLQRADEVFRGLVEEALTAGLTGVAQYRA